MIENDSRPNQEQATLLLRCTRITEEADIKASKEKSRSKQLEIVTKALRRVNLLLDRLK